MGLGLSSLTMAIQRLSTRLSLASAQRPVAVQPGAGQLAEPLGCPPFPGKRVAAAAHRLALQLPAAAAQQQNVSVCMPTRHS